MSATDTVVIGAGPYGLSVAAHLRRNGARFRIFGSPMETWVRNMPQGMFLKSEGFASSLFDPDGRLTLARFCAERDLPYADLAVPVPLETFVDYGRWFQQQAVPDVEETKVALVQRQGERFAVELEGGETVRTRNVVVATGVTNFGHVPDSLAAVATHSSAHASLADFAGKRVAVVGAGQSALETAALLHEQGAVPQVLVRGPRVYWNGRPEPEAQSLLARLRWPISPLGTGVKLWAYSHAAPSFRFLRESTRIRLVGETLGPSGAWWLRARIDGRIPLLVDHTIVDAARAAGGVRLTVSTNGGTRDFEVDQVIAGTGYRVDLERLRFLPRDLRERIALTGGAPRLSPTFESSVPGLYFVGLAAAHTFGPSMRFVWGARVAARRVARRLAHR